MMESKAELKKAPSKENILEAHIESDNLDTLLNNIGQCGRFQVVFVILGYFPLLPTIWGLFFMIFGIYNPGWECSETRIFNETDSLKLHVNSLLPSKQDERNVSERNFTNSECEAVASCTRLTFSGEASTIVTEFGLICDNAWVPPFIISIEMSGVILGSYISGHVGDKLGRKFSIYGGAAMMVVTNIIAIFAISWQMYAVMRFFIGIASGAGRAGSQVYIYEFIPNRWRVFMAVLPFWDVSLLMFSLCVFALKNWKHVHIATALVAFVAFLPVFWLPESLRYLVIHGKLQQAKRVVGQISEMNKRPVPDTSVLNIVAEKEKEEMKTRSNYTYLDLFRRNIRQSSIVLGMIWFIISFGTSIISYSLMALSGDFFVNLMLFSSLPIPMRILAFVVTRKIGSKISSSILVCLASVFSFSIVAIQLIASEESRGTPTTIMAFGVSMMLYTAFGCVHLLGIETFPTAIRSLSSGFCVGLSQLGAVIAPFLIPTDNFPIFVSFLILAVLLLICFIGLLTLRETQDKPLQDNLEDSPIKTRMLSKSPSEKSN